MAGENQVRGYARSKALAAPDWSAPALPGVPLSLVFPMAASDGEWSLQFSTTNGDVLPISQGKSAANALTFDAPGGFSSLAFVATRLR